jgi:hypothetical protein
MFRKFSAVADKTIDDPLCECSESGLSKCIAIPVVAAKTRDENGLMSRKA